MEVKTFFLEDSVYASRDRSSFCLGPLNWNIRHCKMEDFFTDHRDFDGENLWLLKSKEFSFFKEHLDFRYELGKFVSDSK